MIVWFSDDYLGMGQNPKVIKALTSAIDSHGTGADAQINGYADLTTIQLGFGAKTRISLRLTLHCRNQIDFYRCFPQFW